MMADVACFCGCCFSFDGGAGACPRCGEVASLTGEPAPALASTGRSQTEPAALVLDWAEAALSGIAIGAAAGAQGN
jgi:hypothetical protein